MKQFLKALYRKIQYRCFGNITLKPQGIVRGRALVSYVTEAFLLFPHQPLSLKHSNYWECKRIVELLLERGYCVDVISAQDTSWLPTQTYDVIFDIHSNLKRLKPFLRPDGIAIHHIVTSEATFQNTAEQKRIQSLHKRSGVLLTPRRQLPTTQNIDFADAISGLGNDVTFGTYNTSKKIWAIPGSSTVVFPFIKREYEKVRRHLLWYGGGGAVHKGLDLVLDFVASHPEYELTVCGPVTAEHDFVELYSETLLHSPNVHYHGRIDPGSDSFLDIMKEAGILIYPSCSEGQSGAVITALHAGLIPIVSAQSGITLGTIGKTLLTCESEEIAEAIMTVSNMPQDIFEEESFKAWEYAQSTFNKHQFTTAYSAFLDAVLPHNITHNHSIPLVSVIIPTYNAAPTIEIAIDSIAKQTYPNIEIIVVDDMSTDNTEEVVKACMKRIPNLSYHKVPADDTMRTGKNGRNINAGYSARNVGFSVCKGEWITFQDADDASLLNRIELQVMLAERFDSNHICLDWTRFDEKLLNTTFDFRSYAKSGLMSDYTSAVKISSIANAAKGRAYKIAPRIASIIPFSIKTLPVIHRLFWGSLAAYPGTGNSPLFKREIISRVQFRHRDNRIWPSFTGRGADRDFNFQVAETYNNSLCFPIPAYLWRAPGENERTIRARNYIVQ